ncbi:MAG: DUF484 family protein [Pseudomonadota bacterium]
MTQMHAQRHDSDAPSADQVADYLSRHPEFFADHLELLEKITVPHPSGTAVSLIARQLDLLRGKNRNLQHQLNELVEIARENDNLFNRMHRLTLALLDTATLEETLASLEQVLHECFLADFVAIRIIKEEPTPTIGNLFIPPTHPELEQFKKTLAANRPKCGHPTHSQARFLFGDSAKEVLSCAIVPVQYTGLCGILAIGSRQEDRFHRSMGHMFLTQMSEIVGSRLKTMIDIGR